MFVFNTMIACALALAMIPDRAETGFPAVSQFAVGPRGGGIGNGVAIAPRWVLSCGHGAGATYWIQDGKHIKIKRRVDCNVGGSRVDLALYELSSPVKDFYPVAFLPFKGKGGLQGREVRLIGFGETGGSYPYGYDGISGSGGKKRFVTNALDSTLMFTRFAPFKTQVLITTSINLRARIRDHLVVQRLLMRAGSGRATRGRRGY